MFNQKLLELRVIRRHQVEHNPQRHVWRLLLFGFVRIQDLECFLIERFGGINTVALENRHEHIIVERINFQQLFQTRQSLLRLVVLEIILRQHLVQPQVIADLLALLLEHFDGLLEVALLVMHLRAKQIELANLVFFGIFHHVGHNLLHRRDGFERGVVISILVKGEQELRPVDGSRLLEHIGATSVHQAFPVHQVNLNRSHVF